MLYERVLFTLGILLTILCFQDNCIAELNTHTCRKTFFIRRENGSTKRGKKFECCEGYIQDDTFLERMVCKPICMPACTDGTCVNPGQCECGAGYERDATDAHTCHPICTSGCPLGSCVAPETCNCNYGYSVTNGTCQPVCTEPCSNGTCVAPEFCKCHPGFRLSERNVCEPYCSTGCDHGSCIAPEKCVCDEGWLKTVGPRNMCHPVCKEPCGNGTCVAPDTCECNPGYSNFNNSVCVLNEVDGEITTTTDVTDLTTESDNDPVVTLTAFVMETTDMPTNSSAHVNNSKEATNQSWLIWLIVVLLILIILLILLIVKRKALLDYWRGRSYDVEELEAKEIKAKGQENRTQETKEAGGNRREKENFKKEYSGRRSCNC